MSIKVGDWVRHTHMNTAGKIVGEFNEYWVMPLGSHWAKDRVIPCHPPRDKKPPRKVKRSELLAWANEACCQLTPLPGCDYGWSVHVAGNYIASAKGILPYKAIIAARAAMRRKEK